MKKILAALLLAGCLAAPASAKVTAEITMQEDTETGLLWAHARIKGITATVCFRVRFEWTAPEVVYEHRDGTKTPLFASGAYAPEKPCGSCGKKWVVRCADTGEKGCWRTRAYRTLTTTLADKSTRRAVGVWKVRVKREDTHAVLGEATYTVE